MANKGPSYGLSRQVQDKIDSKYDPELEQILVEWITRQCGSGVGKPEPGKIGFQAWLKDGCVSTTLHVFASLLFYNVQFMVIKILTSGLFVYRQYNISRMRLENEIVKGRKI